MRRYLFVLVALSLAAPTAGAAQTTFIVNTTNDVDDSTCDATHCSLREAIDAANQTAGTDTIAFNIPGGGGVQIISPGSALPVITDPVVIDGTSQPGFSDEPIIGLDGSGAGTVDGLHITAGSSVVRALAIYAFDNGILLDVNGGNTVVASVVGSTGKAVQCEDLGNTAAGIVVQSSDNVIGGASLTLSNEIVCNTTDGIRMTTWAWQTLGTDAMGSGSKALRTIRSVAPAYFKGTSSSATSGTESESLEPHPLTTASLATRSRRMTGTGSFFPTPELETSSRPITSRTAARWG
jgi:CSLREA domain-containing protein